MSRRVTKTRRWMWVASALGIAALVTACPSDDPPRGDGSGSPTTLGKPGGSVAIGVWAEPDPADVGVGGAAVRDLTLPQMFEPTPDGGWVEGLVEPKSVRESPDRSSASFVLRSKARWSDGTAISADDLRRSADARFVAGIDGPDSDGRITVRFTSPLSGWRRLWSGADAVSPPTEGLAGGPYRVSAFTPGLQVVLQRNDSWYGGKALLEELRLVLVPDSVTARQLLAKGELDVVAPLPATARLAQYEALDDVEVATGDKSGWWTGVVVNPAKLNLAVRRGVLATIDRDAFVRTLLQGEASPLAGFANDEDPTWRVHVAGDQAPLKGQTVQVTASLEEPMAGLVERSSQKRADGVGGSLELRNAEHRRVEAWLRDGDYAVAVSRFYDGPSPCWRCRWDSVAPGEARTAEAGGPTEVLALEKRLADEAVLLPLWRGRTAVAWRTRVSGVAVNGFAISPAWNAHLWSVTKADGE